MGALVLLAMTIPHQARASSARCPVQLAEGIPQRVAAPAGSEIMQSLSSVTGTRRDARVVDHVLSGHVPGFLRRLAPVEITGALADGQPATVTICVTPEYLALGNDRDFVRVPMGLGAAARIASELGFLLPTPRMVDAIYDQAQVRLTPKPMTPSAQMSSTAYLVQHNMTLEAQRKAARSRPSDLTAGHKKDIVLTGRLLSKPGRVAIYGWHRPDGRPIQPLSTVHGAEYADYSHGVRLISRTAFVNGNPVDLAELIADRDFGALVSGEGRIPNAAALLKSQY